MTITHQIIRVSSTSFFWRSSDGATKVADGQRRLTTSAKAEADYLAVTKGQMADLGLGPIVPPVDTRQLLIVETRQADGRVQWNVTPVGFTTDLRKIDGPAPAPWQGTPSDTSDGSGTDFTNLTPSTAYTASLHDAVLGDWVPLAKTTLPPVSTTTGLRVAGISLSVNNANVTPVGFNLEGPGVNRPSTADLATNLGDDVQKWSPNRQAVVRLNVGVGGGDPVALKPIVEAHTSQGTIVFIEYHDGSGAYPDESALAAFWNPIIQMFKSNPLVGYNFWNEGGTGGGGAGYMVEQTWDARARFCMGLLDAAGASTAVGMFDESAWGQAAYNWDGSLVRSEASAALTYGARLAADYPGRIVISPHLYDQWHTGDEAAIALRLGDYIDRVHALGVCLMIGEVGGPGYHNNAWVDFTTTFQAAVAVCIARRVGLCGWHGMSMAPTQSNDEGFTFVNSGTRTIDAAAYQPGGAMPPNLTAIGQAWWTIGHTPQS